MFFSFFQSMSFRSRVQNCECSQRDADLFIFPITKVRFKISASKLSPMMSIDNFREIVANGTHDCIVKEKLYFSNTAGFSLASAQMIKIEPRVVSADPVKHSWNKQWIKWQRQRWRWDAHCVFCGLTLQTAPNIQCHGLKYMRVQLADFDSQLSW